MKSSFLLPLAALALPSSAQVDRFDDVFFTRQYSSKEAKDDFKWSSISPGSDLVWHPCFESFECARLQVPMNYNATDLETATPVVLAVIKLPARVPVSDPRYSGPILLNPGGPGGSGVGIARSSGKRIQAIADAAYLGDSETYVPANVSDGGKFFDIISWDPRNVGATTPWHACIQDTRELVEWEGATQIVPGTPEGVLEELWSKQMALSKGCMENDALNPEGDRIVDFMTTDVVVRDMVEILEKHGQWREAEMEKIFAASRGAGQTVLGSGSHSDLEQVLEARRYRQGVEPLQYWGFSYGTILGTYFATLEPHRAYRMILDDVADSEDYALGGWLTNLQDTNEIMVRFFEYCHSAGHQNCSMASSNDESPLDIAKRWAAVEDRILSTGPIPVPGTKDHGPQIITMSDIHNLVFMTLYGPMRAFASMSDAMAPISFTINNTFPNATAFAKYKTEAAHDHFTPVLHPICNTTHPEIYNPDCSGPAKLGGAKLGIACRDGDPHVMLDMTFDEWRVDIQQLQNESLWFGAEWSRLRLACAGWPDRPAKIDGHWFPDRSRPIEEQFGSDNTAHPLLFIGNTLDPVTPLRNAHKFAAKFKGSVVLQEDVEGHCSLAGVSLCTMKAIRKYFQTGELVEVGTVCKPQVRPLVGGDTEDVEKVDVEKMGIEERFLYQETENLGWRRLEPKV